MFTPDDASFLKVCGIHVDDEDIDEPYELDGDRQLTYDEALAVLGQAMKRKQRDQLGAVDGASGFAEPEATA